MKTLLIHSRIPTNPPKSRNTQSPGSLRSSLRLAAGLFTALVVLHGTTARASDPVGIYAIIDKVVLEPNETAPERIQVFGTFSVAQPGGRNDLYSAPQKGYLFYQCKEPDRSLCESEWADLKSVAGTGQCVAFAGRFQAKGQVRQVEEKPANPDKYPVAQGVVKVRKTDYPPVKKLYEAARPAKTKDAVPGKE